MEVAVVVAAAVAIILLLLTAQYLNHLFLVFIARIKMELLLSLGRQQRITVVVVIMTLMVFI